MSFKGIELQVALPWTFDVGKIFVQKRLQPQTNKEQANAPVEKKTIKQREIVTGAEVLYKTDSRSKKREEFQGTKEVQREKWKKRLRSIHIKMLSSTR